MEPFTDPDTLDISVSAVEEDVVLSAADRLAAEQVADGPRPGTHAPKGHLAEHAGAQEVLDRILCTPAGPNSPSPSG